MISSVAVAAMLAAGALAAAPIELPLTLVHGLGGQGPMYLVNISIGTPPQEVTVQVDSGSSDLWIFSDKLNCQNTLGCFGSQYNASASSTFAEDLPGALQWSYGSGSAGTGDYVRDDVHIGSATVKNFRFGLTNNSTGHSAIYGLMGLGFPGAEFLVRQGHAEEEFPVLLQELALQEQIDSASFSLYLNDVRSNGNILFGGYDKAKYAGELTEVDVLPSSGGYDLWYVNLTALGTTVKGEETNWYANGSVAGRAFIDSGAPKAFLPGSGSVAALMNLGGQWRGDLQQSIMACSRIADTETTVDFAFGPDDIVVAHVPVSELIDPFPDTVAPTIGGEIACSFGLGPGPDGFQVLGDGFIRGSYIVFNMDAKTVGFGQVKYNVTESEIVAIV
ncbi:acid protease [Thozetella sp. PMI_491]|nr:acid protease [Thozetella sp. PMI_491]